MKVNAKGNNVIIECENEQTAIHVAKGLKEVFVKMSPEKMAMAGKLFSKRMG